MGEKNKISVAYDIEKAHPSISHLGLFNNCKNLWKTDFGLFFEHSIETETLPYSNVEVEIITLEEYESCSQEEENAFKIINSDSSGYESAENFNLSNCLAGMYQCQFCPKFYAYQQNLKRHVDKHHNSENRNKKVSSSSSSPAPQHDLQSKKEAEKDEKVSDLKSFENQLLFMDELENLSIETEKVQNNEEKTKRINNSNIITEEDSIELKGKNLNENARKDMNILNKHSLAHKGKKSLVKRVKFRVNKEYGNRVRQKLNLDPKKCADKSRKYSRKKKTRFWFPMGVTEEKTQLDDKGISNHSPDGDEANCNDVEEDGSKNENGENNDQTSDSMCNRDSCMNNVVTNSSCSDPVVSKSNTELSSDAAPTGQGNGKVAEDANAALITDNQLLFMDELETIEVELGNKKNENGSSQDCDKNKNGNGSINGNKCNNIKSRRVNHGSCIIRRSDRIRRNAKKAQSDKGTIFISEEKSDNEQEASVGKQIVVSHLDIKLSRCADSSENITNDKTTKVKEHSCTSTDSNNNISSNSIEECGKSSNNNSTCNSEKDNNSRNSNNNNNSINSIANQSNSVSENSPCNKSNLSDERNDDNHDTKSNVNGTNIDSISEKISESGKCSSNIDLVCTSNEFKSISSTNTVSAFDLLFSDELESIETKEMYHESKNSKDSSKASDIPIEPGRDSNPTAMNRCQLCPKFYTSPGFSEKSHFPRLHVKKNPDVFECHMCREKFHEKLRVGKYMLQSHSHTRQSRRNIDLNNNILSKNTVRNCDTISNCIISCSKDDLGRGSSSNIVHENGENVCLDSESSETTKEDSLECTICLEKFDDKIPLQLHVLSMDDMDHKRGEDWSTIYCQLHNIQKSDRYSKSLDHKNWEESFPSGTGSGNEERSNIFETLSKYETEHFSSSLDINLNNNTTSTEPVTSESVSSNENKSSTVSTTTSKVKKGRYWKDFIEIICIDGRKTFKCKLCSFVSRWQRSAARHIQVHFSPSFSCEKCGMQIRSRDSLHKHIKYCRSRGQELKCNHCMRAFSTRSALMRHLKMKWCLPGVGNVGTKCDYCGKLFSNHNSLRGHIRMKSCSRSWVVRE